MPLYLIDRREVKEEAKALLKTARVSPFLFTALFLAIDLLLSEISTAVSYMTGDSFGFSPLQLSFSFIDMLVSLLSTVLLAGFTCYCLGVHSGQEQPYESLFDAFPFAGKIVLLMLLEGVLIVLGLLVFIVPGIILAFSYAFALYHLCEDPDIGVVEALRRSRIEMTGYKTQFFMLLLSFLPLMLLFAVPTGVAEYFLRGVFPDTLPGRLLDTLCNGLLTMFASLYITPYLSLARVGFYRRVLAARTPHVPPEGDGG